MNLLGKEVINRLGEKGTITEVLEGGRIKIKIGDTEKLMKFPDSFNGPLSFTDEKMNKEVRKALEERKKEAEEKLNSFMEKISNPGRFDKKSPLSQKRANKPNLAIKCNYCDGGIEKNGIGFCGVCSEEMIRQNIEVEHRAWCSVEDCPCKQMYDGQKSYDELQTIMKDDGFICYESKMLTDWAAYAGEDWTSEKKGKGRKFCNLGVNSLCVLTTCYPDHEIPNERFIFGAFITDTSYDGDDSTSGYVKADGENRIALTKAESKKLSFWDFHKNENSPEKKLWGTGLFRYMDDLEAREILRAIVKIKTGTKDEEQAKNLLNSFCDNAGIDR